METAINYTDKKTAHFSSDEKKWINFIRKAQRDYPDSVRILAEPENNDGCIYCTIPTEWIKLKPKRIISEEEREAIRQRFFSNVAKAKGETDNECV